MAYAAVISLKHTIQRLLNSSQILIVSSSRQIIGFAYEEAKSLQEVLKRLTRNSSSERLKALDGQIRETVYKLDDVLESQVSESLGNEGCSPTLSVDVEEVRQEINSLTEALNKMKEEYITELDNPLPEEEEEDNAVSSIIDFGGNKLNVVGLSDEELIQIKDQLTERRSYEFGVVSLVGMGGTCRTILAKRVFEQPRLSTFFDIRAWVTIGPTYQLNEILKGILSQIDPEVNDKLLSGLGDEKLAEHLYTSLKGTKYLIALDNVCGTQVWDYLRRSFPDENNGSRVLLTTSLEEVALFANSFNIHRTNVLNKEESWDLLRVKVFGEESCPPELEKAGKKIAENCEGLPLEIAKVVLFLLEAEKTPDLWSKVAADKENFGFKDAYDEISEVSKIIGDLQLGNSFRGGDDDDDDDVFSRTDPATVIIEMVELSYAIHEIMIDLFPYEMLPNLKIVSLFGMAGIGKTILAKEIFEDISTLRQFDHAVWVTLGPKYGVGRIIVDILAQIDPDIDKIRKKGDEILAKHFVKILSGKRCLVVLDDAWNYDLYHYLTRLCHVIKFEVLLTTRLKEVAQWTNRERVHEIHLLNKDQSWCLLREKVFAEKLCPPELEKAGKKIAENCEGLPLMIVTVASLLSEDEKTPEYWNEVANQGNLVFEHANDKISKVLLPSYEYLPQDVKACFLYLGVFPQKCQILTSKLFKLWSCEGILEPNLWETFEDCAMNCLTTLVSGSLLMERKQNYRFGIKTCCLHSVFWHLCIREARKDKFFHVLNSQADGLEEYIKSQRRLCIQNSILFGIKGVYNSMASILTARSLLCTGPPHRYPLPICFGLRLLKVLDALTIRFYVFPMEVLKLVQLRYFALTYNGKLPASISKLWNLHCLIVRQHLSTKLYGDPSYLPMEIWDMQELKHLQIMGSNLPDPNRGALLPNLLTLLDVGADSCTKRVLKRIPNLKKLGIQIELRPDSAESLGCLDHISRLLKLKSLKCVIVNPEVRSEVVPPPAPLSMFPSGLKKLSLSGFGYPWEYMRTIANSLPNLKALKLRCYAFRGPEWVMHKGEFEKIRYLLLEDTDLVYWRADDYCFPRSLNRLIIRHCYKLKEIPSKHQSGYCKIELVDCNPSPPEQILDFDLDDAYVHSSWEDGKLLA